MSRVPECMSGAHVAILSGAGLEKDTRLMKEAQALLSAGASVVAVGIGRPLPSQVAEQFGHAVHVDTSRRIQAEPSVATADVAARDPYAGWTGALRHWAGRLRESHILARAALGFGPDVVICADLPTLPGGIWLRLRTGCRVVYDVHDLYTEQGRSKSSLFRLLYGWTERLLMHWVDEVVTVSPLFADYLRTRTRRPVTVVLNGPLTCSHAVRQTETPTRLLFQGNFAQNRNLESLVRAVALLPRGEFVLTLQGWGVQEDALSQLVHDLDLASAVRFVPAADPLETTASAREHDIGVICYRGDTPNLDMTLPNKLFDYVGAGLALAISDLPALRQFVQETGAGVLLDPSTPQTLAAGIGQLLADRQRVQEFKRASVEACRRYAWAEQAELLISVVMRCLDKSGRQA